MLLRLGRAEHARIRERKKNHREHAARHEDDENRAIEKALARLHRRLDHLIAFLMHRDLPMTLNRQVRAGFRTFAPARRCLRIAGCQPAATGMTDAVIVPISGRDSSASVRAGV